MGRKAHGKYTDRLVVFKENRSETVDTNTDSENELYDKLIKQCAEIARDLNGIKEQLESDIIAAEGYCKSLCPDSVDYNYWNGCRCQAQTSLNILNVL